MILKRQHETLWDIAKALLRGKFLDLKLTLGKKERLKGNDLNLKIKTLK